VLAIRRNKPESSRIWENTAIFPDYKEMLDSVKPDAVFIGLPPLFHGSSEPLKDIEIQCATRNVHMFIEKPISCSSVRDVEGVAKIIQEKTDNDGLVVSVGYMFRYSKAVMKMKEIIAKCGVPRAFNARYNCAYETIAKTEWWDASKCGGPIVEQATHFIDLARFLVGEVDFNTIQATAIQQDHALGELSNQSNINEEAILPVNRIPRVTSSFWRFQNGAIGTLMHAVLLHKNKYETELEIWGDGYRLVLSDPYDKCILSVRLPNSETTEVLDFSGDDFYLSEDKVFLDAILNANPKEILSDYADSTNSYKMSVGIREASMK